MPCPNGASQLFVRPSNRVSAAGLLAIFAGVKLLLHLATHHRYGYERDELYFIACGKHLDWGYVDHPPLVPWLMRLNGEVLGYSLLSVRFWPVVSLTAALVLTGLMTRRLGGGRFAQGLAALSFLVTPLYLRMGTFLNIPSLEVFFWTLLGYLLIVLIQRDVSRLWLWVGFVAGIGLLNKHSMLLFGLGLIVGLLLTENRRHLLDKHLWFGGVIAFLVFTPNLVWQIVNGFPTIEFIRNLNRDVMADVSAADFLLGQVLYMQPFVIAVCLAGLGWCFFSVGGRPYRILAWIFVTTMAVLLLSKSKVYYLAPAYPILMALGSVAIERWSGNGKGYCLRLAAAMPLTAYGLVFLPLALPILPIEKLDRAIPAVTFGMIDDPFELTEHFHKEFGWEDQAAVISQVFHDLPEEDRRRAVVLAGNYGEAGAIDFFGPKYGLPPAICGQHSYYFWGPGSASGEVVIAYGIPKDILGEVFESVKGVATIGHPLAIPLENDVPVYVCRRPRMPLSTAWPKFRRFVRIN